MSTGKHLSNLALMEVAAGRGTAQERAHAESCTPCRSAVRYFKSLGEVIREEQEFLSTVQSPEAWAAIPSNRTSIDARFMLDAASEGASYATRVLEAAIVCDERDVASVLMNAGPYGSEARRYALLYSCTIPQAALLAAQHPRRAISLAGAIRKAAQREPPTTIRMGATMPLIAAEAHLMASNASMMMGKAAKSRDHAVRAREYFRFVFFDKTLGYARSDYYEGAALGFLGKYEEAHQKLEEAKNGFSWLDQEHWIARVHAARGLVYRQAGNDPRGLRFCALAAAKLDPNRDAAAWVANETNRGALYFYAGRPKQARVTLTEALINALQHGLTLKARIIRLGLGTLLVAEGNHAAALDHFLDIVRRRQEDDVLRDLAYLMAAECHAILGDRDAMTALLQDLRAIRGHLTQTDPAFNELFAAFDAGDLSSPLLTHVREYFDSRFEGSKEPYVRLWRVQ